jgi:peptidyl-prolyl cis-trans isomerase A (cyclophilin A)
VQWLVQEPPAKPPPGPPAEQPAPRPAAREAEPAAGHRRDQLDPSRATGTAPERFTVVLETTRGDFHVDVRRSWAPLGADRFFNLVKAGFYDDAAFFRVVDGFVAQTGLHADPAINELWRTQRIEDDPVTQSNVRGMVTFATSGKNTRTTQIFVNLTDNARLDAMGFAPFGRVRELDKLKQLHSGYGERPSQARIQREGNAYLRQEFPELDYIKRARVVDAVSAGGER